MNGYYYNIDTPDNSIRYTSNKVDDLLKNNKGAKVTAHLIINNSHETISGILESIGDDYIIISSPLDGSWQLILPMYLSYITFDEPIKIN